MAGRKSKLLPEIQSQLVEALSAGVTDAEACACAGVGLSTFYLWQQIGQACLDDMPHDRKPKTPRTQKPYVEFVEAITRARAEARVKAIRAFAAGLEASEISETISESVTEIRLKKDGTPYDYTRNFTRERKLTQPADWRAGEAWLKRRDPENWSDKLSIRIDLKQLESLLALIEQHGLQPSDVIDAMITELANADSTDGS